MSDRWVNAIIELTIPLDDVAVNAAPVDKQAALARVMERVAYHLPDDLVEYVGSGRWEDVSES